MDSYQGKSKYYILMEDIKKAIREGTIKPGDKLPSENQMTVRYEVSRHTVRKALSILSNEGYIIAEQGRGSFCRDTKIIRGSSKNIAVVTTYISDYIFPRLIQGIDSVLTKKGYSIILKNTKNSRALESECLEDIFKKNIDGMIIEPSESQIYSRHMEIFKKFEEYNIPYVFIHGIYPQLKNKPSIVIDDELGMYKITKYLIELGHKKLVGIFKMDDSQGLARHAGYVKALNENKIIYDPEKVIWYHTVDKLLKPRAEIKEIIKKKISFDSVVCYNDEIACLIVSTLNEVGIRVPDDVSITGFDNSQLMSGNMVGITTVEHPKEQLGVMAAELLLELINGVLEERSKVPRVIKPNIILKDSCRQR
jgi:GntR family transcriptional regulator of arabinose operon